MISAILVSLGFFGLFAVALGLASLMGGKPIQGSCGGLGQKNCFCSPEERIACRNQKEAQ